MKMELTIEVGSNGGFVVTWYKTMPTAIQKMTGIQQEKEVLAFANAGELVKWIQTKN
jgi:hypothetical protein